ncbi:MAG: hypothetical protein M1538_01305 [Candidatus Marsarchaeota archaeon]|nr:hypothetical protein [Candidatus Marsarchaeota archaeon]
MVENKEDKESKNERYEEGRKAAIEAIKRSVEEDIVFNKKVNPSTNNSNKKYDKPSITNIVDLSVNPDSNFYEGFKRGMLDIYNNKSISQILRKDENEKE